MGQDQLFEWYLFQQLTKRAKQKIQKLEDKFEERIKAAEIPQPKTDLRKLYLAYNNTGKLDLADVRPTGFIVKARG